MRKLLAAGFSRMWKSRVFWVLEAASFVLGSIFYFLVILNTRNLGENWIIKNANFYFFLFILCSGIFISIFASLFVGTEYADGTIRNKLTVGHSRRDVYLSNLILCGMAGLLFGVTHILTAMLMGIPGVGFVVFTAISSPFWRLCCCMLIILCYSSIFTFFAMVYSNKAQLSVINILLAISLLLLGLYVFGKLQEPEFASRMVMQEDGSFLLEENIPNVAYVDGTLREVMEWVDAMLPSSVGMHIVQRSESFSVRFPVCVLGLAIVFMGVGIALFKRKDIK